ncbi:acyltransferase family protein [Methylocella tundrae]|uniref:Acyltransferase n=1 Tax=Methylocella tundrae TaxID=227605 RepID=A0A4U8Z660_METTU|nr:acyltransferase family protein [Methylocella tundrae]WPP04397.1 acyltransferase family protein [Methylocella tundrae]VFU10753.1 conserved membrane protein of unknown function [Methylocella tundrae]
MTKFRYDINALRALAVASVVLYHYNVNFVPGGFVGVDIFFVISGYLMTDIIVGRMQNDNFNVLKFYYDRAKRIVPGLAGLCFGLLVVGYFMIDPVRYNTLSYTSVSALLFYSNILFYQSQGYFSPSVNTQWLLHTWSLSAEWQFYLVYPLVLMALNRFSVTRRHLALVLITVALLSLALCISLSSTDEPAAFYLLPQRAWEMAAGGVVALKFKTWAPKYASLLLGAGFLLIAFSLIYFDKNTIWPSYRALIPVIGACLVIAANRAAAAPFRLPVVQTLGRWSYSIYLWHWPIAVAFVYFNFKKTNAALVITELAILAAIISGGALLLSAVRKLGEASGWRSASPRPAWAVGALAFGFSIALGLALTVDVYRGFPNRTPEIAKQVAAYRVASTDWDFPRDCDGSNAAGSVRPCRLGKSTGPETLILGDSFAMQIYHRLEAEKANLHGSFVFLTSSGCPPVTGIRFVSDPLHCDGFFEKALEYAATQNPSRIVLASNWFAYFHPDNEKLCFVEGDTCVTRIRDLPWFTPHVEAVFAALGERLRAFRDRGAEVVLVSATPYGEWDVPSELLKRQFLGMDLQAISYFDRDQFDKTASLVNRNLAAIAASIGATLIDPAKFLCEEHRCPAIDPDGVSYYRDNGHFRAAAVRTDRFHFFDEAVGVNKQYTSVLPAPYEKQSPDGD